MAIRCAGSFARACRRFDGSRRHLATRLPEGALCSDYTFTRILGAEKDSDVILKEIIGAWSATHASPEELESVTIVDRKVLDGLPPYSKGELIVDVRAKGASSNYFVEVQHRVEPLFAHRVVLYTASELVSQHMADRSRTELRPVHALAFCDYDFSDGKFGAGIGSRLSMWRKSEMIADPAQALQSFSLRADDVPGQQINKALAREMQARMSFTFALLPHAPRLEELTAETPPLLRWASLIAHANPLNADAVPKAARTEGIEKLLALLKSTSSQVEEERIQTKADDDQIFRAAECAMVEGMAKGKAEGMAEGKAEGMAEGEAKGKAEGMAEGKAEGEAKGKAEGKAEGMAELLRLLGISSVADYRAARGCEPPPELEPFLKR